MLRRSYGNSAKESAPSGLEPVSYAAHRPVRDCGFRTGGAGVSTLAAVTPTGSDFVQASQLPPAGALFVLLTLFSWNPAPTRQARYDPLPRTIK